MVKLSKPFYLISAGALLPVAVILRSAVALVVLYAAPGYLSKCYGISAFLVLLLFQVTFLIICIYGAAVWLVLWFKAWKAIYEPTWKIRPLKTVLLLFVPFFNLYWVFRVYWGWARTYNDHVFKRNTPELEVNDNTFLVYSIAHPAIFFFAIAVNVFLNFAGPSSAARFPCQGILIVLTLGFWVLNWYIVKKVCDAVNRLPAPAANTSALSRTR